MKGRRKPWTRRHMVVLSCLGCICLVVLPYMYYAETGAVGGFRDPDTSSGKIPIGQAGFGGWVGEAPEDRHVHTLFKDMRKDLDIVVKDLKRLGLDRIHEMKWVLAAEKFGLRGLSWLFAEQGILPVGHTIFQKSTKDGYNQYRLYIASMHLNSCEEDRLDMLVRIVGPEMISGRPKPIAGTRSCAWYFDFKVIVPGEYNIEAKLLSFRTSRSTNEEAITEVFLGCGMSNQLSPCVVDANEDTIPVNNAKFTIGFPTKTQHELNRIWTDSTKESVPLCANGGGMDGRWVDLPADVIARCKLDPSDISGTGRDQGLSIQSNVNGDPGYCWLQDKIEPWMDGCSTTGSCENAKNSFVFKKSLKDGGTRAHWVPYSPDLCRFKWFTPGEVQDCVLEKDIRKIDFDGGKFSDILRSYFNAFMGDTPLLFAPQKMEDDPSVIIATYELDRLLSEFPLGMVENYGKHLDGNLGNFKYKFFMSKPFITSQMMRNLTLLKADLVAEKIRTVLIGRGWIELDWFIPSAGFAYETTVNLNGVHFGGPPIKFLLHQVWNNLCADGSLPSQRNELSTFKLLPHELISSTIAQLADIQQTYASRNRMYSFGSRGMPWLYKNQKMILGGFIKSMEKEAWHYRAYIVNVLPGTCDADKVGLWVRVEGPEIIAGEPVASKQQDGRCVWYLDFSIQVPGEYRIQAKVVDFNGKLDINHAKCKNTGTAKENEMSKLPQFVTRNTYFTDISGGTGFLEDDGKSCCEACIRNQSCTQWVTPGHVTGSSCSLYRQDRAASKSPNPRKTKGRQTQATATVLSWGDSGSKADHAYFLGCGKSFHLETDHPCQMDVEDEVPFVERTFKVGDVQKTDEVLEELWMKSTSTEVPLCGGTVQGHQGRWVKLPSSELKKCTTTNSNSNDPPGHCWLQETRNGDGDDHSYYWLPNDGSCRYRWFRGKEVSQCLQAGRLGGVEFHGGQAAGIFNSYYDQFVKNPVSSKNDVVVSTLDFENLLWRSNEKEMISKLRDLDRKYEKYQVKMFVTVPFISSEEKSHVLLGRGKILSMLARDVLVKAGWMEVNWFLPSAAYTYTTGFEDDGVNILGPPMKQALQEIFNTVCRPAEFKSPLAWAKNETQVGTTTTKSEPVVSFPQNDYNALEAQLRGIGFDRIDYLKSLYEKKGAAFGWRGITWLYKEKHLALAGFIVKDGETLMGGELNGSKYRLFIVNTLETPMHPCESNRTSIWARITGPEILAGAATPMNGVCAWYFEFVVTVPGTYAAESKVVVHNGHLDLDLSKCAIQSHNPAEKEDQPLPNFVTKRKDYETVVGYKFYAPSESCCEVCTRRRNNCTHWAHIPSDENTVCRLFNLKGEEALHRILDTESVIATAAGGGVHGRMLVDAFTGVSRGETEVVHFLGCGWSYDMAASNPCVDEARDDDIPILESQFVVGDQTEREARLQDLWSQSRDEKLPLCGSGQGWHGRWVDIPFSAAKECSKVSVTDPSHYYDRMQRYPVRKHFQGDPGYCWLFDNFGNREPRCKELNCVQIQSSSRWFGSKLLEKVKQEKEYHGVWVPYQESQCRYKWFTQVELQQCLLEKKISKVEFHGVSMAEVMEIHDLGFWDGHNLTLASESDPDAKTLLISSLMLPHVIWHDSFAGMEKRLEKLKREFDSPSYVKYFTTTQFISSERENHVLYPRGLYFSKLAVEKLTPSSWKEVRWFDQSAAFTYEAPAQLDGLHLIGPPVKYVLMQIWNDLCK